MGVYGFGQDIAALAVYNGELYAGGAFIMAGENPASYIAKWNGVSWDSVGTGMNNAVMALAVYNGELYAGGGFTTAGGIPVNYIAKWNGTNWDSVGAGIGSGVNIGVLSLAVYNGELYAGGEFTIAGGNPGNYIAKWNGTNWDSVGAGMNIQVLSLAVYNGELYAGGYFTTAGGNPANYIAKWYSPPDTTTGIVLVRGEKNGLNVYPNPTKDSFTIETHFPNAEKGVIRIYGIKGELIKEYALKKGTNSTILNTSGWAKGVYVCSLEVGGEVLQSKRMVVE